MLHALRSLITRWFAPANVSTKQPLPDAMRDDTETSTPADAPLSAGAPHPGPYDENLLERSRTLWRQGDWSKIASLDLNEIEHHPDRAKLGLIVASAWLQQGDDAAARRYMHNAIEWGCDKKIAAQILVAGVHNSLGRVAAINGDEARMELHFRGAVSGGGGKVASDSLGRRHAELSRLGQFKADFELGKTVQQTLAQDAAVTYPPHGITSYAQNFEDVMLWRALWDVENGFYIDVGAWDPVIDSVSKAFHEHDWCGVHVEPLAEYAEKLRQDRPEDRVIQALVSQDVGEALLHAIPLTGLSTTAARYARNANQAGWPVEDRVLPCVTLAQVFSEVQAPDIHWLKIDVEGMESDVLAGWGDHQARPWVVVIEATEPLSSVPSWSEWESQLFGRNYRFVYFDGLNRFYLYKDKENLINRFSVAPNVFDKYVKFIPESRPDSCIPNNQ